MKPKLLMVLVSFCVNVIFRNTKQDQPDPTDLAIVDLQGTRIGRPGMELAYFLLSSTSPEQRKEHFGDLVKYYHDRFIQELNGLESSFEAPFTLEELRAEVDNCYVFGFIMGCGHAQVLLVPFSLMP